MMKVSLKSCAGAILLVAALTGVVSAGTITHSFDFPPGPDPVVSGPGLGLATVPLISTLSPNNDNQPGGPGGDNNVEVTFKRFDRNLPIDIVFTVRPSGGTSEYRVAEFVDNFSGTPWAGYRLELGTGVGLGFVPGGPVDFDAPLFDPPPTSTAMVPTLLSPHALVYSGFHAGGAQQYNFRIDVPDLSDIGQLGQFTLRQVPIPIPEPTAFVLAGMVMVAFAWCRRRA